MNHLTRLYVVVATAKVQIFKQITTVSDVAESRSSCCCYRKGTNFQANHNMPLTRSCVSTVVVATAKVQIFKQITTTLGTKMEAYSCCCYRKGTNFQANHNKSWLLSVHYVLLLLPQRCKFSSKSQHRAVGIDKRRVVVATAKVQIFKQITTYICETEQRVVLLLLPQRYKFSSKSQQLLIIIGMVAVVVATAKVQIFKQITTAFTSVPSAARLLLLPQRYKFSSKSQPFSPMPLAMRCCCCYRKGTNFQANHN